MSGDYSRWSFDPRRHFGAVLMQQGRVQTDADWNEWVATVAAPRPGRRARHVRARPWCRARRPTGFRVVAAGRQAHDRPRADLRRRPARREPRRAARWSGIRGSPSSRARRRSPYDGPAVPPGRAGAARAAGAHLVYLKVWQRERHRHRGAVADRAGARRRHHDAAADGLAGQGARRRRRPRSPAPPRSTEIPGFAEAEPDGRRRGSPPASPTSPVEPDPCLRPAERRLQGPREPALPGRDPRRRRAQRRRPGDVQVVARQRHRRARGSPRSRRSTGSSSRASAATTCSASRTATGSRSPTTCRELDGPARRDAPDPGRRRRRRGDADDPADRAAAGGRVPGRRPGRAPTPARNTRVRRWDQHGRVLNADGDAARRPRRRRLERATIPVAAGADVSPARARRRRDLRPRRPAAASAPATTGCSRRAPPTPRSRCSTPRRRAASTPTTPSSRSSRSRTRRPTAARSGRRRPPAAARVASAPSASRRSRTPAAR